MIPLSTLRRLALGKHVKLVLVAGGLGERLGYNGIKVPTGEVLNFGDDTFVNFEEAGIREVRKAAFILVAGGIGERLGYNEIKALMLNDKIHSVNALKYVLRKEKEWLSVLDPGTQYSAFEQRLQNLGLERGWDDTAKRVSNMFELLLDLLEAPDSSSLEKFLGRIPMVFNVVILSPHGYFAQDNVLGYRDIGGQVVYILNQVRAMESEMLLRIKQQGVDFIPKIIIVTQLLSDSTWTTCNQRLEKVYGCEHVNILRVPFRSEKGIVRRWISRFEVWPFLETFTEMLPMNLLWSCRASQI